ncbi:MAG: ATP-dependent 6-phosphofructokinase [Acidimicrobiia bacterium]|nr:ATP-dependent 6-phosphofructokinase [Acidimicrobiia bacterium]NNL97405.1 ATP-dependent 6-phosphofructokinase [Acidimicrobiia bacterium]
MRRIAALTSGGDAPGMNAALRAVAKVAAANNVEAVGIEQGYEGLIDGRFVDLTVRLGPERVRSQREVDAAGGLGGTILGSSRSERFLDSKHREQAAMGLRDAWIDGLVVIGGNGSAAGAHAFAPLFPVVVVPASIDNDIGCTRYALGVDTALNTIVEACDRISDTARAHKRVFIVEVMGRQSGYLAMSSAVAAAADAMLIPERQRTEEELLDSVEQVIRTSFERDRAKKRVLIIKAEGVPYPTTRLTRDVAERVAGDLPDVEVRATVLGHLVRGGSPTFRDRMIAGRLGLSAVAALAEGASDEMVAWEPAVEGGTATRDPSVHRFALDHVLADTEALLDGSSPVTQRRVKMTEAIEGVLAL